MTVPRSGDEVLRSSIPYFLVGMLLLVLGTTIFPNPRSPADGGPATWDFVLRVLPLVIGGVLVALGKFRSFAFFDSRRDVVFLAIVFDLLTAAIPVLGRFQPEIMLALFQQFMARVVALIAVDSALFAKWATQGNAQSLALGFRRVALALFWTAFCWTIEYPLFHLGYATMHLGFFLTSSALYISLIALAAYAIFLVRMRHQLASAPGALDLADERVQNK
jgi:hypothetical protein